MKTPAFRRGTTRAVLIVGSIAIKFALHERGARCNWFEADLYGRTTPKRKKMLCPVIWCSENSAVLVLRSVTPLRDDERDYLWDNFPDWSDPPDMEESPLEPGTANWGWFDGRLVAVDYSANVA
jgi:hypothetical protein